MYQIVNIRTGEVVGQRATRRAAQRRADKLDMQYGAINYGIRLFDRLAIGSAVEVNKVSDGVLIGSYYDDLHKTVYVVRLNIPDLYPIYYAYRHELSAQ